MTRKLTFQIGLEHYEFVRFAAIQTGDGSPEAYLECLLMGGFSADQDGTLDVRNTVFVLKNAPCPHEDQELENRSKFVALDVSNETWRFAKRHFADDGYFDALDFLHGMLNMALMKAMHNYDMLADRSAAQAWRPYWLQNWLGKVEAELDDDNHGDFDDEDFPF